MGLDINAYKKLKVIDNPEVDEDGYAECGWCPGGSMDWSESHWPGRGEGVRSDLIYDCEESYSFRAGSYSGYNYWRDELARFSNGKDFYELIEFADNEGVIGSVVSKKLLNDFRKNRALAENFSKTLGNYGESWLQIYDEWMHAFELAAEDGAVEFS